ncbi:MAG: hypothetical protein KatS3mg105_4022 [Gemmatales bacterium]|nr:MAG: hypothetical protein KatS3mg105_4022 [Gemmatales bacterium]
MHRIMFMVAHCLIGMFGLLLLGCGEADKKADPAKLEGTKKVVVSISGMS